MKVVRLSPSSLLPDTCEWYMLPGYLNHPYGIGNKLWKLEGIMADFHQSGKQEIISFGGAYSNHLYALATICKESSIPFTAIIRGEKPANPGYTLRFINDAGTKILYISRAEYKKLTQLTEYAGISEKFPDGYIVPEGGSSQYLFKGFEAIALQVNDWAGDNGSVQILLPAGTGGTAAGWIVHTRPNVQIHVINVLKNAGLDQNINQLLAQHPDTPFSKFTIHHQFHLGGYARYHEDLVRFINEFYKQYQIPLDPVYTGKLVHAAAQLAVNGIFKPEDRVLLIHTGGLQGIAGFNERWGNKLNVPFIPPL